ncbi:MAG: DUF983 domain-containing protein [Alphaproteobacteria bacterium]|nr:DUF983 domain-containing protein [Alphaproteobacteria bacterium]
MPEGDAPVTSVMPQAGRRVWPALRRGLARCCPRCGIGRLYRAYLKINAICGHCGLDLETFRADDAPAYFTIAIVGHIVVPAMLILERAAAPESWVHWALWLPPTLALSLGFLPRIKGAVMGVNWAVDHSADRMQ